MSVVGGDQVGYQYVVMRCVPRVDREEFVNIGVVLYCQAEDFLASGGVVDEDRLRALWSEVEVEAVRSALATVAAICAGEGSGGQPAQASMSARFGFLSAPRSTVVQPGPVHGGLLTNNGRQERTTPATALEELLDQLVR
jgi:Protein of unknown function (DUF3037)